MQTPLTDEIKSRIPEPRAIEDMIALAGDMEKLLRKLIKAENDWHVKTSPLISDEIRALLGVD